MVVRKRVLDREDGDLAIDVQPPEIVPAEDTAEDDVVEAELVDA